MNSDLPNFIDTRRFIDAGKAVSGTIAPARLTRISAPYAVRDAARLTLRCVSNNGSDLHLRGEVAIVLGAVCQRCMGDMNISLARAIEVRLRSDVKEEDTELADEDEIETLAIADDQFEIAAFAEDEIILGCPMIPMHAPEACAVEVEEVQRIEEPKKKPFADLASLMAQKPDS